MPGFHAVRNWLVACAFVALAAPAAQAASPRPITRVYTPLELYADTLAKQSLPAAHAYIDSLRTAAAARGDRATEAAADLWTAKRYATHDYEYDKSLPYFLKVLPVAHALRDTFVLATIHVRRGWGAQIAGRNETAVPDYETGARYAHQAGVDSLEGMAHRGLGAIAKMAGQYDRAQRELALADRQLPVPSFEWLHTQLLLGEMLVRTGHPDEAQTRFQDLLVESRRRRNRWMLAASLMDLGNVSYEQGDMAQADRDWAQAAAHFDSLAARGRIDPSSAIGARANRAHALIELDRLADARALLDQQIAACDGLQDPGIRVSVERDLGILLRRSGQVAAAERTLRSVRAATGTTDSESEETASLELAGLLRDESRIAESEALLDSLLAPARRARMASGNVAAALIEKSANRRALGHPDEALAFAREAEQIVRPKADQPSLTWFDAAVELGHSQRDAGTPEKAVATLSGAARAWERWRLRISNLEWRERAGSGLSELFAQYGLALLDSRRTASEAQRARQAFDALQVFQGRTLEERMLGSGLSTASMARRVTSDSLRARVLRPGETLLDLVATPETTFAFVVTTQGVAARMLPGTTRLGALYTDWRGAMLGGADGAMVSQGLARLSGELLGPVAPLLAGRSRIVVSGGGPVSLWPIVAFALPGESRTLGETREIAATPSATMFALLRRRAAAPLDAPAMLAVARTTDAEGRGLDGAEREVDRLGKDFAHVTVRSNRGDQAVDALVGDLARFDALHLSAHTEAAPGAPWRSGLLLGKGAGEDAYLRASTVSRMKLKARLAVLSGCQSAGALALAGEGSLGLSSGFLCAGTTTVIATLWPVEDRVADRFMSEFYAGLAAGQTTAAAARDARLALKGRPETANPRDWAAFVVVGEPGTTLRLTPRVRA